MCKYCCFNFFNCCCCCKKNKVVTQNVVLASETNDAIAQQAIDKYDVKINEYFPYKDLRKILHRDPLLINGTYFRIINIKGYFYLMIVNPENDVLEMPESQSDSVIISDFNFPSEEKIERKTITKEPDRVGWKFCISCQDDDLPIVWAIVQTQVISQKIHHTKVLPPNHKDSISSKQITIYMSQNPNVSHQTWEQLISNIEDLLRKNKVAIGKKPSANRMISNSLYISYRNDTHPDNQYKYISNEAAVSYAADKEDELPAYNLVRAFDPFGKFSISPSNDMLTANSETESPRTTSVLNSV